MSSVIKTTELYNILRFFERPTHPSFIPKGTNKNVYFAIPKSYYPLIYKDIAEQMVTHFNKLDNGTIVEMEELPFELNLSKVKKIDSRTHFTLFNPLHVACCSELINILMKVETKYLISACSKIQLTNVNPYLFDYALSVVLLHREDTRQLRIPSQATYMPEFYVANSVLNEISREVAIVQGVFNERVSRRFIEIPTTSSTLDPESQLSYFREDIGIALHHWHWHIVFPFDISGEIGLKMVNKDRRGELFYYMHQQILARYNAERLCNNMSRVRSFNYLRDPIPEAYYPKLGVPFAKNMWASRPVNTVLKDLNRESLRNTILEIELWRSRILDAIHFGRIFKGSETIPLDEETGIDILGNVIEASALSPNRSYYGNLHNSGHLLIAYAHDPDNRYLENIGVMGDTRTALRDPIFYRWHTFIDDIFQEHKSKLLPYTKKQLSFREIRIIDYKVITKSDPYLLIEKRVNELITFMQVDKVNLAHGLNVTQDAPIYVAVPHLQHREFLHKIMVENIGMQKVATVRIFLAPTLSDTGKPFLFNEQRRLFIELDKFIVTLRAKTTSVIRRSSRESTVTIPFKQMFADVDDVLTFARETDITSSGSGTFCGCGWPEHMLLPKGNSHGFQCQLFVMITDFEHDKVENKPLTIVEKSSSCATCIKSAPSYCGLQNMKYPDKRAMGFPFDRPTASDLMSLEDFLTPNMRVQNVKITHLNEVIHRT